MKFSLLAASASAYHMTRDQVISPNEYKYMAYISKFGKQYNTVAEYKLRLALYEQRIAEAEAHNSQERQTSTIGENEFTDWT